MASSKTKTNSDEHSGGATATSDAWKTFLEQLQQGVDPKDRKNFDEFIKRGTKIRILVTGATGVGKSTLLNGLVGKNFFKTGDELERVTTKVTEYKYKAKGVDIIVFDSPGLHDVLGPDQEEKYVQEMFKKIKAHNGIDLILYCKQMDTTTASIKVEKDIIQKLTVGLGKLKDDRGKKGDIGKDIWRRSLFVLTFANIYEKNLQEHSENQQNMKKNFENKVDEWKRFYKEALNGCGIHVPVRICPAGYRNPKLCTSEHWLSDFWAAAFETLAESGALALLRLNQHRILESATSGEFQNPEEQPIVLTDKVRTVFGLPLAGVGAAGTAGAVAGATIGATIGAVAIGVVSFGPAAGVGLVLGGAIGAAVGTAIGGGILRAWQRHKAKKEGTQREVESQL